MPPLRSALSRVTRVVDAVLPSRVLNMPAPALQRIRVSVGAALLSLFFQVTLAPLTYFLTGTITDLRSILFAMPMLVAVVLSPRWSRSATLPGAILTLAGTGILLVMSFR